MGRVMDPARMDHAAKGSAKRGPQIEGPILAEQKGNKLTLRTSGEGRGRGGRVGRSVDAAWPLFGRRHFASQSWPTLRRPSPTPAYLQPSAAHPILFLSPSPHPDAPASSLPPSSLPSLVAPFPFPLFPSLRTSASDLVAPLASHPAVVTLLYSILFFFFLPPPSSAHPSY